MKSLRLCEGIQFETLKVFCDVARFRSFSQGAAANGVTQSAASQMIRQLEKRLGIELIDRSTRPLQLTRVGHEYYEGVREVVARYLELETKVRQSQAQVRSNVQVVAIYSVGLRDMNQYQERFQAAHPDAQLRIDYQHSQKVYDKVLDGTADLGIVSYPRTTRTLTAIPWRKERMVIVCAPGHRLATRKAVRLNQIADERFVGFNRGTVIRQVTDRFLRDHNVMVDVGFEFDNIENVKQAIEAGSGISILPLPTVNREVRAGTLAAVHISDVELFRPLAIIHRRTRKLSPYEQSFIDLLLQPDDATVLPPGKSRRGLPELPALPHKGRA